MSETDQGLLVRCKAGDQSAFKELVEHYQGRAYAVAFSMLGNRDDALDVVQEAFVRVHRHVANFKGNSGFYTWLYRIVFNLCIDQLRKAGRADMTDYDDSQAHETVGAEELLPRSLNPAAALERGELRQQIDAALEELSPAHRSVILLREVEGLSYTEMAKVMSCSKGTIMSRLFHARRRMQEVLLDKMAGGAA